MDKIYISLFLYFGFLAMLLRATSKFREINFAYIITYVQNKQFQMCPYLKHALFINLFLFIHTLFLMLCASSINFPLPFILSYPTMTHCLF